MIINSNMEYIAKEISIALKNKDWARVREANIYKKKCNFTFEEKRWIDTMVKNLY